MFALDFVYEGSEWLTPLTVERVNLCFHDGLAWCFQTPICRYAACGDPCGKPMVVHLPTGRGMGGHQPSSDTERVIRAYVKQCRRGRAVPLNFEARLRSWLQDLSRLQRISPRRKRYWTIPAYALAHNLHSKTFCKRLRELEKIAKRILPDLVPEYRKRAPLTEEEKHAIRARFKATGDFHTVASEFGIGAFRVGQLCRAEKAQMIAEREKQKSTQEDNEISTPPFTTLEEESF